jgi:hypothetical protein
MSSSSTNNHRPRVARTPDKGSLEARLDRSALVQSLASGSPIWLGYPEVESAGNALIQAGVALAEGDAAARKLDADAESAVLELISARIAWDERFNVYAGQVELFAVKPEDVGALGLLLLEEGQHKLAPPLDVLAHYDRVASLLRVAVVCPAGRRRCRIEISPSPLGPGSYQEIPGHGASRALAGYAPGDYWVRAAMADARRYSEFFGPVLVTVS